MYMEGCRSRGILLPCFRVGEAQHAFIVTWPIDNKTNGCSARGRGVRHRLAGAVTSMNPRFMVLPCLAGPFSLSAQGFNLPAFSGVSLHLLALVMQVSCHVRES